MADMGLVVVGAAGRMGRMLVRTIHQTPGARLAGAVEAPMPRQTLVLHATPSTTASTGVRPHP